MNPYNKKKGVKQVGSIQLATKRDVADAITDASVLERGVPVDSATTTTTSTIGSGAVDSVAGRTGVVTLSASDIAETAALKILTAAERTKLSGIEALADVTDATNVEAAGAVMETDAAGGDLSGTYPNPSVVDDSHTHGKVIDLGEHLDEGGSTDNFFNWFDLEDVLQPYGGLSNIVTVDHGTGWAEGVQACTISGGTGTGAAATAVAGNPANSGRIAFVTVTAPGSGYRVVSRQIGPVTVSGVTTSGTAVGSDVININTHYTTRTLNIVAGMSITHPAFPAGTTVASTTATTVTASANATIESNYSWIYFGIPQITFGGTGSGWVGHAVVGNGKVARIPPGLYKSSATQFMCLHNTTIEAEGAVIIPSLKTQNGVLLGDQAIGVKIVGLTVQNFDTTVITPPEDRGVGFGFSLRGYNNTLLNTKTRNIPNFSVAINAGADELSSYYQGFQILGHTCQGCGGDGIHIGVGVRDIQITNPTFITHGDDAIAVYPDLAAEVGVVNPPYGISIVGVDISDNAWRGIFLGECSRVSISGVTINGCGSFAVEMDQATDIAISGVMMHSIGNTGDGYRSVVYTNRFPVYIDDCERVSMSALTFGDIAHSTLINVSNSTDVLIKAQTISGKTLSNLSGNTNVTVSA
tara:strand:- start:192 stop:2108 length:1917 start_codon:yes stop_codon:yes gene_type:complete